MILSLIAIVKKWTYKTFELSRAIPGRKLKVSCDHPHFPENHCISVHIPLDFPINMLMKWDVN